MSTYDQVYKEFMRNSQDPAWMMAFEIALGEWMQDIAVYHQGPIQAVADKVTLKHLNTVKDDITKRFLLTRMEEIRKAGTDERWDPRKHRRDKGGRFTFGGGVGAGVSASGGEGGEQPKAPGARMIRDYVLQDQADRMQRPDLAGPGQTPMDGPARRGMGPASDRSQANGGLQQDILGRMSAPVDLDADGEKDNAGDNKAEALKLAASMTYSLTARTGDTKDKQRVQYTIVGPDGQSRIEVPQAGVFADVKWEQGERVRAMAPVGPDNPVTVAGQVMNIGIVAGMNPENAAKFGSVGSDIRDTLNTTDWGRRLQNTTNVMRVISDESPRAAQAHAVAQMINLIGPDAARAFGPKMRQLSYRYTGQEAHDSERSEVARKGMQEGETRDGYEQRLIEDLKESLPTQTEYKTALQAGSTPPSKGYILSKNNQVTSEAVGFSDDWYTPFNLRKLPTMKDGTYVRTRGYGGLTPEDIRLAMQTGVKKIVVVSNTGTYAVDFSARGLSFGHRFGFGGSAMVRRYQKSLDAISEGNVANPDSPNGGKLQLDHRGYQAALADLKMKYPFFVQNVRYTAANEEGQKYPKTGTGGAQDQADREGYVKPLRLRATGAQFGWANKDIVTYDAQGREQRGKQAYDQLEQYRLRQSGGMVYNKQTGSSAPAAAPRTGYSAPAAAAVQGAGTPVRSYGPADDEKIDSKEARRILDDVMAMFKADPEVDLGEELGALRESLDGAQVGAREWTSARDKIRDDKAFRDSLISRMQGSEYADTETGKRLLPGLDAVGSSSARDDEVEGSDKDNAAAVGFDGNSLLSAPMLDSSPRLNSWKGKNLDPDNPKYEENAEKWTLFRDVMAKDWEAGDWVSYNSLSTEDQERFDEMHKVAFTALNDDVDDKDARGLIERESKQSKIANQEDTPRVVAGNLREQAAAGAPSTSTDWNFRDAIKSTSPRDYGESRAQDIVDGVDPDKEPDGGRARVIEMVMSMNRRATTAKDLTDAQRERLRTAAKGAQEFYDTAFEGVDDEQDY